MPDISKTDKTFWMGEKSSRGSKAPNIIEVLMQSVYIGSQSLARDSLGGADIVIEPQVAFIGPGEFHRAPECVLQGELAAVDAVPKLKRLLT
jgi:predicted acylesterase/phospholipase RssA